MHSKISQRLQQRIEVGNNDEDVALTVLLKSSLPQQIVENAMLQLQDLGAVGVQYIPISGTLHCQAPMKAASEVSTFDAVEYIDIESTADIEDLLDG